MQEEAQHTFVVLTSTELTYPPFYSIHAIIYRQSLIYQAATKEPTMSTNNANILPQELSPAGNTVKLFQKGRLYESASIAQRF
jgi:hypothetical protein